MRPGPPNVKDCKVGRWVPFPPIWTFNVINIRRSTKKDRPPTCPSAARPFVVTGLCLSGCGSKNLPRRLSIGRTSANLTLPVGPDRLSRNRAAGMIRRRPCFPPVSDFTGTSSARWLEVPAGQRQYSRDSCCVDRGKCQQTHLPTGCGPRCAKQARHSIRSVSAPIAVGMGDSRLSGR